MRIIEDVRCNDVILPHVVMTVGSFDGVHVGHRFILEEVVRAGRAAHGTAALLTMRPHPREYFSPDHAPNLLTSEAKKLKLLENAGLDAVFFLPFNSDVASLSPIAFIEEILAKRCHARRLLIGHDFCFGKDARGDYQLLIDEAPKHGFEVAQVPPVLVDGERVSSTLIRERILLGDLDKAERFLGRRYSIVGEVESGRGIGSKLGYPTANIKPHHSAVPAQGVYVAEALVNGGRFAAAVNIGIAPTIRQEDLTIEAFLLDFHENVLHREIEIVFHKRLRPERKFSSYDALIAQIGKDVGEVRAYFGM